MKYRSVFVSQDLKDKMNLYLIHTQISKAQISLACEIDIRVHPSLPLDSAVFMNHIGDVVGIYSDGKLVEIPLDSAINYLAHYPLAIKKKPLLEQTNE